MSSQQLLSQPFHPFGLKGAEVHIDKSGISFLSPILATDSIKCVKGCSWGGMLGNCGALVVEQTAQQKRSQERCAPKEPDFCGCCTHPEGATDCQEERLASVT